MTNAQTLAQTILNKRNSLNPLIMPGQLSQEIGSDGMQEAINRRWLIADMDSGFLTVNNRLAVVEEIRQAAEICESCGEKTCQCAVKKPGVISDNEGQAAYTGSMTENAYQNAVCPQCGTLASSTDKRGTYKCKCGFVGAPKILDKEEWMRHFKDTPDYRWVGSPRYLESIDQNAVCPQCGTLASSTDKRGTYKCKCGFVGVPKILDKEEWMRHFKDTPDYRWVGSPRYVESIDKSAAHNLAHEHANRPPRNIISEIGSFGTGNPGPSAAPAAPPAPTAAPAPARPAAPASPSSPGQPRADIGDDVAVVENGKTFQAKVQSLDKDGRYTLSFGQDRPPAERLYEPGQVKLVKKSAPIV